MLLICRDKYASNGTRGRVRSFAAASGPAPARQTLDAVADESWGRRLARHFASTRATSFCDLVEGAGDDDAVDGRPGSDKPRAEAWKERGRAALVSERCLERR